MSPTALQYLVLKCCDHLARACKCWANNVVICYTEMLQSLPVGKKNCCSFERLFKVKKSGIFLFGISFFILEICAFLCYVNEESDGVINGSTKTIKHWIKNISRDSGAVFFRLGTRNVHYKRNRMTPTMSLPWQHSWLQSLSVINQISPFETFLSGTEGLAWNTLGSDTVLTVPIRLLGVNDPYVR